MKPLKGAHSRGVGGKRRFVFCIMGNAKCAMLDMKTEVPHWIFRIGFRFQIVFFVWSETRHLQASTSHPHQFYETHLGRSLEESSSPLSRPRPPPPPLPTLGVASRNWASHDCGSDAGTMCPMLILPIIVSRVTNPIFHCNRSSIQPHTSTVSNAPRGSHSNLQHSSFSVFR